MNVGGTEREAKMFGTVIERHFVEANAAPLDKHMELTVKNVTPFAGAKAAPLLPAAHVWR